MVEQNAACLVQAGRVPRLTGVRDWLQKPWIGDSEEAPTCTSVSVCDWSGVAVQGYVKLVSWLADPVQPPTDYLDSVVTRAVLAVVMDGFKRRERCCSCLRGLVYSFSKADYFNIYFWCPRSFILAVQTLNVHYKRLANKVHLNFLLCQSPRIVSSILHRNQRNQMYVRQLSKSIYW